MDKLQEQIDELKIQIDELNNKSENLLNESETSSSITFSNLEVKNSPVKFRFPSIFPKESTSVIKAKLEDDTAIYIPFSTSSSGSSVLQYQTTLTADTNSSDTVITNYTQTIDCGFTPHTLIFYGNVATFTTNYLVDGMALKNATTTTGTSRWQQGTSAQGQSTTKIGYATEGYFTVSTWGTSGVTISKTLHGYYAGCTMTGVIILLG